MWSLQGTGNIVKIWGQKCKSQGWGNVLRKTSFGHDGFFVLINSQLWSSAEDLTQNAPFYSLSSIGKGPWGHIHPQGTTAVNICWGKGVIFFSHVVAKASVNNLLPLLPQAVLLNSVDYAQKGDLKLRWGTCWKKVFNTWEKDV